MVGYYNPCINPCINVLGLGYQVNGAQTLPSWPPGSTVELLLYYGEGLPAWKARL